MTGAPYLIFALCAGMALGAFFSVSLWSSVRRLTGPRSPWYLVYGNFVIRMCVVLIGFYLVMAGHWERMVATLLGFVIAREIMVRRLGRKPEMS
jgi:F1F0 ATPase subunit 2